MGWRGIKGKREGGWAKEAQGGGPGKQKEQTRGSGGGVAGGGNERSKQWRKGGETENEGEHVGQRGSKGNGVGRKERKRVLWVGPRKPFGLFGAGRGGGEKQRREGKKHNNIGKKEGKGKKINDKERRRSEGRGKKRQMKKPGGGGFKKQGSREGGTIETRRLLDVLGRLVCVMFLDVAVLRGVVVLLFLAWDPTSTLPLRPKFYRSDIYFRELMSSKLDRKTVILD